jgi:hypothetical protein
MRNLHLSHIAIAALALAAVACGPGSSEVKAARTARYKADKAQLINAARAAVEGKQYKVAAANDTGIKTVGHWYNPEGQIAAEGNSTNDTHAMTYHTPYPDKSLYIYYNVGFKPDGDSWVVDIKPSIERYHAGQSQTEVLKEDDISLPGWVEGKTEGIAVAIHDGLKQWEVKTVPGPVPAGSSPAPAPAPDGSAAAPAPAPAPAPQQ